MTHEIKDMFLDNHNIQRSLAAQGKYVEAYENVEAAGMATLVSLSESYLC